MSAEARANALATMRALQTAQAAPAEYLAPLTAAIEAVDIRGMQRRRQRRHLRAAVHSIEASSPDAARTIDGAVDWLARYP